MDRENEVRKKFVMSVGLIGRVGRRNGQWNLADRTVKYDPQN